MTAQGLSSSQAHQNLQTYGPNSLPAEPPTYGLTLFLSQFPSVINTILFLAAALSVAIGNWLDCLFILATLLLNAVFGFVQEYKAEKSLEKLKTYAQPTARVLRDGQEHEIKAEMIVPQDVVLLQEGDRIPADGVLVHVVSLEVDESVLTGESLPVRKQLDEQVFSGTLITKGKGRMVVQETGAKTRFGQITQTLSHIKVEKTPLERQLASLGRTLSLLAVALSLLLVPIGLSQHKALSDILLLAASIGIAAIPEGLPAVITIALAIGTTRMAKVKVLVRQLPAVETLGSVQVLLIDKTGTITQNSMTVTKVWEKEPESRSHILQAAILGNTASLVQKSDGKATTIGDKTDGALLLWAENQKALVKDYLSQGNVIDEFVFDTQTKTVTTVWKGAHASHVFVRGAPEEVLKRSTLLLSEKERIQHAFEEYARQGLRVVAFGTKTGTFDKGMAREEHEKDLTFLGFVGIQDPPRDNVSHVLAQARSAGIRVMMVTGDNELTASAIAKQVDLINHDEVILTGAELQKMSDQELVPLLETTHIIARALPEDKLRVATLLQQQGFIVGVTGDGVNDALALKKADVGVAMGESGTDVAKEASDIIITDDHFATLVEAVEQGRSIYRNIVTAIVYLLTTNFSELCLVIIATSLGLPTVLLPTQILWINLVTDSLPALALATDRKAPHLLAQRPRDPRTPILTRKRSLLMLGSGLGMAVFLVLVYGLCIQSTTITVARTVVFNSLVGLQLVFALFLRRQSLLRVTPFLLITLLITLGLQAVATFLPFFQNIFQLGLE